MEKQLKDIYEAGNLLFTQENVLNYKPGGFHPVCLGDTFKNGRYKVHHKLGFGGYGTVWLANDSECVVPNPIISRYRLIITVPCDGFRSKS